MNGFVIQRLSCDLHKILYDIHENGLIKFEYLIYLVKCNQELNRNESYVGRYSNKTDFFTR